MSNEYFKMWIEAKVPFKLKGNSCITRKEVNCRPLLDLLPADSLPESPDQLIDMPIWKGEAIYDIDENHYAQYRAIRQNTTGWEMMDFNIVVPQKKSARIREALHWKDGDPLRYRLDDGEGIYRVAEHLASEKDITNALEKKCKAAGWVFEDTFGCTKFEVGITLDGANVSTALIMDPEHVNGAKACIYLARDGDIEENFDEETYARPDGFWGTHVIAELKANLLLRLCVIPTPIQRPKKGYGSGKHWLLCIAGRNGCGKTTIKNLLRDKYGLKPLVTYTTRAMRNGEKDGVDYHFVSKDKASEIPGKCLATHIGNVKYFSTEKDIRSADIAVLEPEDIKELQETFPDIGIMQAQIVLDKDTRLERLRFRCGGNEKDMQRALRRMRDEDARFCDYEREGHPRFHNNDAEKTADEILRCFVNCIYGE